MAAAPAPRSAVKIAEAKPAAATGKQTKATARTDITRAAIQGAEDIWECVDAEMEHEAITKSQSGQWNIGEAKKALERCGYTQWAVDWRERFGHFPHDAQEWPVEIRNGTPCSLRDGNPVPRRDIR